MIYCPKCGTANRDGSKFCNECGEGLGSQTQVKCPQCGALNPVQNVFCEECGGQLLPSPAPPSGVPSPSPIKGLSLPSKVSADSEEELEGEAEPSEVEEELPAWLRELGLIHPPTGPAVEAAPAQSSEGIPDWLRELSELSPIEGTEAAEGEMPEAKEVTPVAPMVEPEEAELPEWLAALRPVEPAEAVPPAVEPEEAEIPEWLAELRPVEPAEAVPPAVEPEEAELPEWLAELRPGEPAEAVPPVVGAEEAELPEWLAALRPVEPVEAVPPAVEPEEAELPEWLAELRPVEPAEAVPPVVEPEETEFPEWLAALRPVEPVEAVPPVVEPEETELPEWLAELRPVEAAEAVPPAVEPEEAELPEWLAELRPGEPAEAAPPVAEPEEAELPEWLAELRPIEAKEAAPSPPPSEAEETRVPDWLTGLEPRPAGEPVPPAEISERELAQWLVPAEPKEEGLPRAEIPDWLISLKPQELDEEKRVEEPSSVVKEEEGTGLLAGLQGILPAEMIIAQPRAARPRGQETIADLPQARLFAEIVSQPLEVGPRAVVSPRPELLALLPRWIIFLALIAAVAFPLLLEKPLISRSFEPSPEVAALYRTIEALPRDATVLIGFDYDPAHSGEMDVVARAVVTHLMDREARLIVVSLLPAGPATAQRLLDGLMQEHAGYAGRYGQRYVNLGFLPGQAAALRSLGQSLRGTFPQDFQGTPLTDLPVMDGMVRIEDVDLVIELTAGQDMLRTWIEQVAALYKVPVGAGVSAAIEPIARSYFDTEPRRLVGVVGGVPGAAMYESGSASQGLTGGDTAVRLDSQMGGHLVLILVLLVGGVIGLMRHEARRER